jgi:hypothetical protein
LHELIYENANALHGSRSDPTALLQGIKSKLISFSAVFSLLSLSPTEFAHKVR